MNENDKMLREVYDVIDEENESRLELARRNAKTLYRIEFLLTLFGVMDNKSTDEKVFAVLKELEQYKGGFKK